MNPSGARSAMTFPEGEVLDAAIHVRAELDEAREEGVEVADVEVEEGRVCVAELGLARSRGYLLHDNADGPRVDLGEQAVGACVAHVHPQPLLEELQRAARAAHEEQHRPQRGRCRCHHHRGVRCAECVVSQKNLCQTTCFFAI